MVDRFARVTRALRGQPWAMLPEAFESLLAIVAARIEHGGPFNSEELLAKLGDKAAPVPVAAERYGSVAVLPLYGVLSHRMNLFSSISGGTSTAMFAAGLQDLMKDPAVQAIVIDGDTPGGAVAGTEEAALVVQEARRQDVKPIVLVANTLVASGGYWIGSQAHEIVASPSSRVGSIGIAYEHTDVSKANEVQGVKTTLVRMPPGKMAVNQYEPLTDETRDVVLGQLQPFYDMFVSAVARGRGVSASAVRDGYGQGAVLSAPEALAAQMVDRIDTIEHTVNRLSSHQGRRAAMKAAADDEPSLRATSETTAQEPAKATAQESAFRHRVSFDTQLINL